MGSLRGIAISCLHAPITSEAYWRWLTDVLRDVRPDVFVNLGDWYEGKPAKRFSHWPDETWSIIDEHRAVAEQAREINSLVPGLRVWLAGNHDDNVFGCSPDRIPDDVRAAIRWQHNADVSAALADWRVIDEYGHRVMFRLGPITFQHGCAVGVNAGRDGAYEYGTPFGLYVSGHTHRPVPVTQCVERRIPLPYWYANPGCGADWDRMHYMRRCSMAQWGRGAILFEVPESAVANRRTAYATRVWQAQLLEQAYANGNKGPS